MKSSFLIGCFAALAAALAIGAVGSPAAKADIYVIESTAATVRVGSRLGDGDALALPAGSHIRAVLPSGKTQTIRGPYNGSVGDLSGGQTRNEGVLSWVRTILQTGGATEATPGATRSIGIARAQAQAGFSWTAVPVNVDGNICVEKGASLQLTRPSSLRFDRLTIVDVANAAQAEVQWSADSQNAAWPGAVAPRPDAAFLVLVPDRPRRQVTLRVLDQLPSEDDVLSVLQARDCRHQFEAWVREKMAAAKRNPS